MADTIQRTIEILFSGEDSGFSQAISGVYDGVDGLAQPLASATTSLLAFDAAIVALAAGGLLIANQQAGEFEDGMNEINTMANLASDGLAEFSDDILQYSKNSSFAMTEIQTSVYNAISLGADYKTSLELLRSAEMLAIGGKAALNASLELLKGTMNAYGAEVESTGIYSDTFFTIVEQGKTTIPELAASLAGVTVTANAANIPIEAVGAAVAALTSVNISTAESVTKLGNLFAELVSPSDALKTALGGLTVQGDGIQAVMVQLQTSTGGSADKMNSLFGSSEAAAGALVLANDSSGKFAEALDAMAKKTGAAEAAYTKMADNSVYQSQRLLNAVNAVFVGMGEQFSEASDAITLAATNLFLSLSTAVESGDMNDFFEAINKWGLEFAEYLEGIAKAVPEAFKDLDFSGLLEELDDIKELFAGVFGDLDLTDTAQLHTAFQTTIDVFEDLARVSEGVFEVLGTIFSTIAGGLDYIGDLDDETLELLGNIGGAALAFTAFSGVISPVIEGITGVVDAIDEITSISWVSDLLSKIGTALVTIATSSVGAVTAAGLLGYAFGTFLNSLPGVSEFVQNMIQMIDKIIDFTGQAGEVEDDVAGVTQALNEEGDVELEIEWFVNEAGLLEARGYREELAEAIEVNIKMELDEETDKVMAELDEYLDKNLRLSIDQGDLQIVESGLGDIATYKIDFEEGIDIEISTGDSEEQVEKVEGYVAALRNATSEEMRIEIAEEAFNDGINILTGTYEQFGVDVEGNPIILMVDNTDASEKIEEMEDDVETIPHEKLLEIKLQGDIDVEIEKIKTYSDTIQASMEWEAKLDIATVEADMERFTTSIEVMGSAVESSGANLVDLYEGYDDASRDLQVKIDAQAAQESKIQLENHELLSESLRLENERQALLNEKMRRGDSVMTVKLDEGIEVPMREMYQVFAEGITTSASAEGLDILVGGA